VLFKDGLGVRLALAKGNRPKSGVCSLKSETDAADSAEEIEDVKAFFLLLILNNPVPVTLFTFLLPVYIIRLCKTRPALRQKPRHLDENPALPHAL